MEKRRVRYDKRLHRSSEYRARQQSAWLWLLHQVLQRGFTLKEKGTNVRPGVHQELVSRVSQSDGNLRISDLLAHGLKAGRRHVT